MGQRERETDEQTLRDELANVDFLSSSPSVSLFSGAFN